MKVAILYVAIGKYTVFWEDFYKTCEGYFLPTFSKEYFVFTDKDTITATPGVNLVSWPDKGWPRNTLDRYEMFSSIEGRLRAFDFIVFLNANLKFIKTVGPEVFLPEAGQDFVAVIHPGYYRMGNRDFPYERRPASSACLEVGQGQYYFQGAINGGRGGPFISAVREIRQNILEDSRRGIVAKWHDESHWNKFLCDKIDRTRVLGPNFVYPEGWDLPFEPAIISRDKTKYGGHQKLRNEKNAWKFLKGLIKRFLHL